MPRTHWRQGPAVRIRALLSLCQARADVPSGLTVQHGPSSGFTSGHETVALPPAEPWSPMV